MGLWLAMAAILVTGCGKSGGNITGKVYYKDTALTGGSVTFHGEKSARSATIQADGSYAIKGMAEGEVRITVSAPASSPNSKGSSQKFVQVPPELGDKAKSKEKYTVKSGNQEYDIRLK
jgi:hypothetical protein